MNPEKTGWYIGVMLLYGVIGAIAYLHQHWVILGLVILGALIISLQIGRDLSRDTHETRSQEVED